jgi:hypothetical protein
VADVSQPQHGVFQVAERLPVTLFAGELPHGCSKGP